MIQIGVLAATPIPQAGRTLKMSNPYEGDSNDAAIAGIKGINTAQVIGGSVGRGAAIIPVGVSGSSNFGVGVYGESQGQNSAAVGVQGTSTSGAGVLGSSSGFDGVHGESQSNQHAGVSGVNNSGAEAGKGGPGISGSSSNLDGVQGWSQSRQNAGVSARNTAGGYGVWAQTTGPKPNTGGIAGYFNSDGNTGVHGETQSNLFAGVTGINNNSSAPAGKGGPGLYGSSSNSDGIQGWSQSSQNAGVSARNTAGGYGVWAQAKTAGYFDGDVDVTGTLNVQKDIWMPAADFAEDFPVQRSEDVEPGSVMALDDNGMLRPSERSYDRKVVGVVSGAGDYRPGLILDREESSEGRLPLALVGKVYCKVDATHGPIEVGDLLTTSPTPGHAMKASDPLLAFGAVIGKALKPLKSGQALLPILVALQ